MLLLIRGCLSLQQHVGSSLASLLAQPGIRCPPTRGADVSFRVCLRVSGAFSSAMPHHTGTRAGGR
eukprot:COSAG01_NODE_4504_length_4970_cov_4.822008_3_plen_66_part_00